MPRVGLVMAVLALAACSRRGATDVQRQRWEAERQGLHERLEQLEERMLADQARVRFWLQMRDRHESVSAVACANLGRHAEDIAHLGEKQREKRDATARKNRVAARFVAGERAAQ